MTGLDYSAAPLKNCQMDSQYCDFSRIHRYVGKLHVFMSAQSYQSDCVNFIDVHKTNLKYTNRAHTYVDSKRVWNICVRQGIFIFNLWPIFFWGYN